jgi:DNA-directed RNA polymerase specialized sigma24 family protein
VRLPSDGREALLLHHVWGFSFVEIGGLLGIRGGTAKLRAHRALTALRSLLGGGDDDSE